MAGSNVAGYSVDESQRLDAQAGLLPNLIHANAIFSPEAAYSKPAACGCANDHAGAEKSASRFHRHRLFGGISDLTWARDRAVAGQRGFPPRRYSRAPLDRLKSMASSCASRSSILPRRKTLQEIAACRNQGQSCTLSKVDHGTVSLIPTIRQSTT